VRSALVAGLVVGVSLLAACGSAARTTPGTAPSTAVMSTVAPAANAPSTVPAAAPAPAPVPAAPTSWTMPDLVGSGLQDAQNAIQKLTGYGIALTSSHDATGQGRHQVSDRNWKVCDQNVKSGATITTGTRIDFGAVKLDESC
jgi:hypothetical protein